MLRLLILVLCISACGRSGQKEADGYHTSAELQERYRAIQAASHEVQDSFGFVETEKCDSILMSSLAAVGRGERIDLASARDSAGQWYRRPLFYDECYASGGSKSTISRDMFTGIFFYLFRTQDLDALRGIQKYGKEHSWVMGQGVITRTPLGFGLQGLLAGMIRKLEGGEAYDKFDLQPAWGINLTDFEAHLQILSVLMYGEVYGFIPDTAKKQVKIQHSRQPKNPLFALASAKWVDGDYAAAEQALLNGPWPSDRLGTQLDYCTPWVIERDFGPNWFPCEQVTESKRYSGGDWLFVARLLMEAAGEKPAVIPQ